MSDTTATAGLILALDLGKYKRRSGAILTPFQSSAGSKDGPAGGGQGDAGRQDARGSGPLV
jgi:hypothetical protein